MRSGAARMLERAAPVFAALGDPVRLRVVARLADEGPLPIVALVADSGVTRQAVSKHLRVLQGAGLVKGVRHGRESVWTLASGRLQDVRRHLDLISAHW